MLACALGTPSRARGKHTPPAVATPAEPSEAALRAAFDKWKAEHGVTFASPDEEEADLRQWAENDASIRSHNAAGTGFELGHNAYSAYSWGQFQTLMDIGPLTERRAHREVPAIGIHAPGDYNGNLEKLRDATRGPEARARAAAEAALKHSGNGKEWASVARSDKPHRMSLALGNRNPHVPEERDWVAEGGVSNVYDQGSCGSVRARDAESAVPTPSARPCRRRHRDRRPLARRSARGVRRPPLAARSVGPSRRLAQWRGSTLRRRAS
jgi:hypothetical protein